jgi:hypothetical protein
LRSCVHSVAPPPIAPPPPAAAGVAAMTQDNTAMIAGLR